MTDLEKETCSDGFLLCLLETWQDRAQGTLAFQAKLFDGGRLVDSVRHAGKPSDAGPPVARLLKLLYRVIQPPHVLAVYGLGWMELIQKSKPEILPCLRILDLYSTAIALSGELRPRAATADIARAYGTGHQEGESLFFSSTVEHILWAVLARAGERGRPWARGMRSPRQRSWPRPPPTAMPTTDRRRAPRPIAGRRAAGRAAWP